MQPIEIRHLGLRNYDEVYDAMREANRQRDAASPDQIWFLQHEPVYTLGQAGRREHILDPGGIEVVETDRGGQVTYHGPGQLIAYIMLDLPRRRRGVKWLVCSIEQSLIDLCRGYGIEAMRRDGAPGVYVGGRKLAALGLRVRRGCSYHGLALNVDMDLEPFARINPCGYEGLEVTQLSVLGVSEGLQQVAEALLAQLREKLEYNAPSSCG